MKARPWKGRGGRSPSFPAAVLLLALLVVGFTAEMASCLELAQVTAPSRLRLARGEGEVSPAAPSPDLALISEVVLEQIGPTGASVLIRADRTLGSYESFALPDPPRLVVDIPRAQHGIASYPTLPAGSLVQRIRSSQYKDSPIKVVRLVFELSRPSSYQVETSGGQLRISLGGEGTEELAAAPARGESQPPPGRTAPSPPPSPPRAAKVVPPPERAQPLAGEVKRISLDFKDADIHNVLRLLADVSGANIVVGPKVKGTVTVRLTNVPWEQALEMILKVNGLGYIREDSILRVAELTEIAKELEEAKKKEIEEKKRIELEKREKIALAPLEQEILPVNYVSADKLLDNLRPLQSRDPDTGKPRGELTLHTETKSIIITDTREAIEKMKAMASRLDIQTPQVMIEARIVTVSEDYSQSLGIQWGGAYAANLRGGTDAVIAGSNPVSMSAPVTGTPDMGAPGGADLTGASLVAAAASTGSYILNLPASPPAGSPVAGAISLGYIGSRLLLDARLSLAESEGKVRTLSSPKVATLDNKEAEIKSGVQVPFTTIDPSSGRLTISFQEAYLRLKVKPHVTSDRKINMEIEAENNTVGRPYATGVGDVVSIDKRIAKTEMLADNGSTVVLGGLYVSTERWSEDRIPLLGRIPVLGWLFKRRQINPTRQELLIFITPTIIEERKA
jgi:type IV pilus assembly protein PilQ